MASKRETVKPKSAGRKTLVKANIGKAWIDRECAGCKFGHVRLERRFRRLVEQISGGVGASIPLACQDWTNTKAAYRFFSNERVSEKDILHGHFQSTRRRFEATAGPILLLHDTSEFVYKREEESTLGIITRPAYAKSKERPERHPQPFFQPFPMRLS